MELLFRKVSQVIWLRLVIAIIIIITHTEVGSKKPKLQNTAWKFFTSVYLSLISRCFGLHQPTTKYIEMTFNYLRKEGCQILSGDKKL